MKTPSITAIINLIPTLGWANFTAEHAASILEVDPASIPSKKEILRAFHRHITEQLQDTLKAEDLKDIPLWEGIMEVILCRLELLTPYKDSLQKIYRDIQEDPCLFSESFSLDLLGNDWLWENISAPYKGIEGKIFEKISIFIYGLALRHWLKDESETLDSTMAFLDATLQWIP